MFVNSTEQKENNFLDIRDWPDLIKLKSQTFDVFSRMYIMFNLMYTRSNINVLKI